MREAGHQLESLQLCAIIVGEWAGAELHVGALAVRPRGRQLRGYGTDDGLQHSAGNPLLLLLHMTDNVILQGSKGGCLFGDTPGATQLRQDGRTLRSCHEGFSRPQKGLGRQSTVEDDGFRVVYDVRAGLGCG